MAQSVCTCCLEFIDDNNILTPCNHGFHRDCLHYALSNNPHCPNCRTIVPTSWRNRTRVGARLTSLEYWALFTRSFGTSSIGPHIPSFYQTHMQLAPPFTNSDYQKIRLTEMRMKFNIPSSFLLSISDLWKCEHNGRNGIFPEWSLPAWYNPL